MNFVEVICSYVLIYDSIQSDYNMKQIYSTLAPLKVGTRIENE